MLAETEVAYLKSLGESRVPEHLHDGLMMFVVHGVKPGDFLTAVLENNLLRAFEVADPESEAGLRSTLEWLYTGAPSGCWISPGAVLAWCLRGGLLRTGHAEVGAQ